MRISWRAWSIGIALAMVVLVVGYAVECQREQQRIAARAALLTRGDPTAGLHTIARFDCGGCHEVPGVPGALGRSAPPLTNFGARAYVAGELRNTPENLVHWIMHPHEVEAKTAMPEMGVSERDARDMAAYLYTLQ